MIFRKTLTSIGSLRKQDFYHFDITEEQKKEAMKRVYENPLLIFQSGSVLLLYNDKGRLRLNFFISYYGFLGGFGEHGLEKEFDNCVKCKCGEVFHNKVRKKGIDYLNEHLEKIKKRKEELK